MHVSSSIAYSINLQQREQACLFCMHMQLYLHAIIKHCECEVFLFYLSGTLSRDFPYLAPIPQWATQREGRGKML